MSKAEHVAFMVKVLLVAGLFLHACSPADPPEGPTAPPLYFTDVTEEAGLSLFRHVTGGQGQSLMPEIVGGAGGVLDYDGDGWMDILLVAGGTWAHLTDDNIQGLHLYRNNGDGTFSEVTEETGLLGVHAYGLGMTAADYDNDGDEDIYVTTLYNNMLFKNEGGRFVDVTLEAGLGKESVWSTSALFFDANRDGWLDLFVGNYVDWSPEKDLECLFEGRKVFCTPQEYQGRPSHFYLSNGDGTFTNRTEEAGFMPADTTLDKTLGVAEWDYNNDGWPDLVLGNDTENDMLFENQGDGTFRERGLMSGIAVSQHGIARAGMGIDTGVVDSSGYASMFVGNFSDETLGVYRYTGNGQFQDRAAASRLGHPSNKTLTFGIILADFDNDTDLDLLAANGHVQTHIAEVVEGITFKQPPQLYLNRGNGVFDEFVPAGSILEKALVARSVAYLDYDRDGDLDVLLVENNGPAHLWRNDSEHNNWIRVHLTGKESNTSALGAVVQVFVDGLMMERRVRTGSSYLTVSEKIASFGLAGHTRVDSLKVTWPTGKMERFFEVDVNQEVHMLEGEQALTPVSKPQIP